MTDYEALWSQTKPAEFQSNDFPDIPDGYYQAYIEKVVFNETTDPHKVRIQWRITGPTEAKRVASAFYKMHARGMARLYRDIGDLGLIVLSYKALPEHLQSLVGKTGTIKLETSDFNGKPFQNVYYEPKETTQTKMATKQAPPKMNENDTIPF